MKEEERFTIILDKILIESSNCIKNKNILLIKELNDIQLKNINIIIENAESQKSVLTVLITSLLKKIENPKQDVRLHRDEFKKGYSGRSLDTRVVTPWLKKYFPRIAPKESGWLTRSLEQPRPFNLKFPGKIRNLKVKKAFLQILDDIESRNFDPKRYLKYVFIYLLEKSAKDKEIKGILLTVESKGVISINSILEMLEKHFSLPRSSRLPVIAIYSIYQILINNIDIYKDKILKPLKTHTSSDRYIGFGDIEVYNSNKTPFEIIEIKHGIPIDLIMIEDSLKKVINTTTKRYFILTTSIPNFKNEESEIYELIKKIKSKYNIDFIVNGIIPSIKYYLRFLVDLHLFINQYTENLKKEYTISTDIKDVHIEKWNEILREYWLIPESIQVK